MSKSPFKQIFFTLTIASSLSLGGCQKNRPDQYPDGTPDTPVSRQDVVNANIQIKLGSQPLEMNASDSLRAENQGVLLSVSSYSGPDAYASMFQDLTISGRPNEVYTVRFALDRQFLTAYKEVADATELTPIEKELAAQFGSLWSEQVQASGRDLMLVSQAAQANAAVSRVPIFKYKLEGFGVVDHVKNDLNEQTNTLRLDPTDWSSATTVQFSTRETDRLPIQIQQGDTNANRVFAKSKLDGQIFTNAQIGSELQIADRDQNANSLYYMGADNTNLTAYQILSVDSSAKSIPAPLVGKVSENQYASIQTGDAAAMQRAGVLPCSANAKTALSSSGSSGSGSCYMVESFQVGVSPVVAQMKIKDDNATADLEYDPPTNAAQTDLILISKNPTPSYITDSPDDFQDPRQTLVVGKMQGEFMMTRTLTDSPSQFADAVTGFAGGLEIVRFVFEKNQVRIVRSQALVQRQGMDSVDNETLMTLPATYAVLSYVDKNGVKLAAPTKLSADPTTPGAIALVDWTKNSIQESNSPLSYYGIAQCFDGDIQGEISGVVYDQDQGQLSFNYTKNYQSSNDSYRDCAGVYSYMHANQGGFTQSLPQTTYQFKQRLSFKAYDSSHDKQILLDLPLEAQKQLGFGLFTSQISVPDQYGNTNKVGSQKNLVSLWDLSGGKKITYVLAGLPKDGTPDAAIVSREDIIQAARDVVKDLNKAFHQALQGSPLDRSGDIIELKVEGDDAPVGELGDINRNTIYWVQKQYTTSLIGLAQAQPNPRSGLIENANVYVYGGNIIAYAPLLRQRAQVMKDYMAKIVPADKATLAAEANIGPDPAVPASCQMPAANSTASVAPANSSSANSSSLHASSASMSTNATGPVNALDSQTIGAQLMANPMLYAAGGVANPANYLDVSNGSDLAPAQAFAAAYENAKASGAILDPNLTEAAFDANLDQIVRKGSGSMSANSIAYAQSMGARTALQAKVQAQLQGMGVCLYDRSDVALYSSTVDITAWTDKQMIINILKPTLAHEMGHTFGLRHNFQGSYDAANWKFSSDEKSKREYSSIMDYMEDDHITYDGMGPYDVAALRAGYTGRLELADGSFAQLTDVLKSSGASNWTGFTRLDNSALAVNGKGLKHYFFCTDEDTLGDPTCRRFDKGTTPLEIVNHDIFEYKAYYPFSHLPLDNLSLSLNSTGNYISGLFSKMLPIRKFMDETIYQASVNNLNAKNPKKFDEYLKAVERGLWFFDEVIRTPDIGLPYAATDDRFLTDAEPKVGKDGKAFDVPHLVERKSLADINVPDQNSDELLVRGIVWDKVIASIMLTERSFGYPRYTKQSIGITYPNIEMMMYNMPAAALPTNRTLREMISGSIQPMVWSAGERYVTSGQFTTAIPANISTMRTVGFFGVLGAILHLDSDTEVVSDSSNASVLYRILGTSSVPANTPSVIMPGTTGNGEGDLRYWSPSNATISNILIRTAAAQAAVSALAPKIEPLLAQWVVLKYGASANLALSDAGAAAVKALDLAAPPVASSTEAAEPSPDASGSPLPSPSSSPSPSPSVTSAAVAELSPLAMVESQINGILSQLTLDAGENVDSCGKAGPLKVSDLADEMKDLISRFNTLAGFLPQVKSGAIKQSDLDDGVQQLLNEAQANQNNVPAFALLYALFNDSSMGPALVKAPALLQAISASLPVDVSEGISVTNFKILDDMYVKVHPEALREYK